jgi:hypothetical protein
LATADQLLSLDQWPPEGRTLGDIVEQLVGPAVLSELTELAADRLSPRLKTIARWTAFDLDSIKCQPLLRAWNSGNLIAMGRRDDPLSAPIKILPPSTVWVARVVDFTHSVIEDPIGQGKEIYDLRFFLPEPQPKAKSTQTASVDWVAAEAKRMKAAGEINEGTSITNFAKLLADRMDKARDTDKSISPVGWQHIKNMLRPWGLWPIETIE